MSPKPQSESSEGEMSLRMNGNESHDDQTWEDSVGLRRRKQPESVLTGEQLFFARPKDSPSLADDSSDSSASYSSASATLTETDSDDDCSAGAKSESFLSFRLQYLIVHIAIMLADGLQGTHLYVLYEGYGYSVASLYCLGFISGAITSPFIGPIVDKMGRKNAAVTYCILEIVINLLEQYDVLAGLIISRIVGGITTNLLFSVFEAWLVTEHRKRGFSEEKLEIVMRDSVVTSNLSAIASGYLAHTLACRYGPVGPFEGAVACTFVALLLVVTKWDENYGSSLPGVKSINTYMHEAFHTIISDPKIYKIGIIQGLTDGTLQTFVFLWSPALRYFSTNVNTSDDSSSVLGLDENGEPAYGLIFGSFMACGVLGGLFEPALRKVVASFLPRSIDKDCHKKNDEGADDVDEKPVGVELLAAMTYIICACLLAIPLIVPSESPYAFTISLSSFLMYEFFVGLYMPCEGVIRSIYMPNDSICSLMTMLRVIINVIVAAGVYSTNYISFTSAFAAGSISLTIASCLQLSLIDKSEWSKSDCNNTEILLREKFMHQILSPDQSEVPSPEKLNRTWSNMSAVTPISSKKEFFSPSDKRQ